MLPHFKLHLIFFLSMQYLAVSASNEINKKQENLSDKSKIEFADLQADASDSIQLSATSHKIIANGWPSTSPMWPSIQTSQEDSNQAANWSNMVEPFIYADKPRSVDYSLLLTINDTVLNILKSRIKPMAINLSFEYYFNHDAKIALPGIKIEVDRKQFRYLESNDQLNRTKIWLKFNEQISITDPKQFSNRDWLKFSLVIRQSPSLVAIRHLKAEFLMSDSSQPPANTPQPPQATIQPEAPPPAPAPAQAPDPRLAAQPPPPYQAQQVPQQQPPIEQYEPNQSGEDQIPAASNILDSRIKPVGPKKNGWSIWGKRRKKRQVEAPQVSNNSSLQQDSIVLTCFRSDKCDWTADGSESVQWSLARMPPSTGSVQNGYYYVSNRQNYGDSSKLLRLSLNQTDSATIADQNSDHCMELALYVTEKTYLKLYRLKRAVIDGQESFSKGSLLITWAPTMATEFEDVELSKWRGRKSLPNAKLAAQENNQNGWTLETLCFADFFHNPKECGSGSCFFGFEMETELARQQQHFIQQTSEPLSDSNMSEFNSTIEQVVGVALLHEYTVNVPVTWTKANWLETWQRDEVEPGDSWKFYPKLDVQVGKNNISLLNLYHDAHYSIESDWLNVNNNLDLTGSLAIELTNFNETILNETSYLNLIESTTAAANSQASENFVFSLKLLTKLVDSSFNSIYTNNSTVDWPIKNNNTLFNLGFPITEHILEARNGQLKEENGDGLFKIIMELIIDCHWLNPTSALNQFLSNNSISYKLALVNISVSDRCFPNPCQFGACQQNGTGYEDWNCECDERHRGRRCEFGRWCNIAHITPWIAQTAQAKQPKTSVFQQRQPRLNVESITRVTGKEYCQRKLGAGSKCTDIDLALNDNLYTEEDKTFMCTCQDDFYLSDDTKCKQAHLCNSVVCPSIGMICDESKPFNRTQPCHCNEKQDWFPDQSEPLKCVRHQCLDKQRDCQFDAHICLPTLAGEKPICKCGPKFTLKVNEKSGQRYCDSTACVLPTLNNCEQICVKDNSNLEHPYTCACQPGFSLNSDARSCSPNQKLTCKPACNKETQICTESGCKCKQGYIGEGEVIVQHYNEAKNQRLVAGNNNNNTQPMRYVQSVKCLNVCSLTYAENKAEFEMVESVCPLGLCDPTNFQCRCSDSTSSALINTKYEPIYANSSSNEDGAERERISPLCHLRRVCEPDSTSYKICRSQGAICVHDYTKAAMFDCICPPSTEKKFFGQASSSEFTCEPRCSAKKYDCLRRQAVCKLIDKDQVRCNCLPGLMFDQHEQKCYLAKYSYAFNLIIVNRYYEPEAKFHKLLNTTTAKVSSLFDLKSFNHDEKSSDPSNNQDHQLSELVPQFNKYEDDITNIKKPTLKSIFITDYNQCNITQVIPKSVIEDPYEHDIESYLSYIDQCNEKIHQNVRTYHLNSKLSEDLRQSLRQHVRDFTVTTNNSSCLETDSTGMYLNCTVYLQSNEPISSSTIDNVFNDCDKNGQSDKYCWIKPRLLLKKSQFESNNSMNRKLPQIAELNFHQVIPCEIDNFCGSDAYSIRLDEKMSLCSCKCPLDIEVIDVKDLEPRRLEEDSLKIAVKEICAPRNNCGANSTFCLAKTGSVCHYDIRLGSRCNCVYPSYEDSEGKCVEVNFSQLDNTLIVIIILLGTGLVVSMGINFAAATRSKSLFGRSKQYPLNEFTPSRPTNRSTGIPNPTFTHD